MTPDFYYLETDGQIFLVQDGKSWRFPKDQKELPCAIEPYIEMPVDGRVVLYARPVLKNHPTHWFHKDEVIGRADIDSIVQRAVNRTLPRGASKVAIIERDKVLMVKAARGITKGYWNLPGGFMGYGEHPEETAVREAEEEVGLKVRLIRLLGVYRELFPRTGGYMISFVYLGKRLSKTIRPHPEEIEKVEWMKIKDALADTQNPFARAGLRDYINPKRRSVNRLSIYP